MTDTARLDALEARIGALEDHAVEQVAGTTNNNTPENYAELKTLLLAAGCPGGMPTGGAPLAALKGLAGGMTPALIAEHWSTMVAGSFGGDWARANRAGHGANWRFPKERIPELIAGVGIGTPAWGPDGETQEMGPLPIRPSRGTSSDDKPVV